MSLKNRNSHFGSLSTFGNLTFNTALADGEEIKVCNVYTTFLMLNKKRTSALLQWEYM